MMPGEARRRLKRRVIIFLVIANTALWASYAWLGSNGTHLPNRPRAAAAKVHPSQAPAGR